MKVPFWPPARRLLPARLLLAALVSALLLTLIIAPAASAQTWTQVTVQRGDTLAKIARRYCTTWREIYNLNRAVIGANPNYIRAGALLTVPNRCGAPGDTTGGIWDRGARLHSTGVFNPPWYTVARGDTLASIARRFGTTVQTIRRQNGIAGNVIHPAQVLFLGGGGGVGQQPPIQPTPVLPPPPTAERVTFEPNAISASRTGAITVDQAVRYVLQASAGQQMNLFTTSFGAPLHVQLTSPTGQAVALAGTNGWTANSLVGWLPVSGDYTVTIVPIRDGTPRFDFNFHITFVIQ